MNVVAIAGSPRRKANSTGIANLVCDLFRENGDEVTRFVLNRLSYQGCQGCKGCKKASRFCLVNDDLSPVLRAIAAADVIIFSTPVYWGEVSAQLKALIDRMYSFLTPDFMTSPVKHRLEPGKKLIFIQSQAAESAGMYSDLFKRYKNFFEMVGFFESTYFIQGCGLNEPGEYLTRPDIIEKAKSVVEEIVGRV